MLQAYFERGLTMIILKSFWKNENGAAAIEYGLIAALIAVVVITGVSMVGTELSATFTSLATSIK